MHTRKNPPLPLPVISEGFIELQIFGRIKDARERVQRGCYFLQRLSWPGTQESSVILYSSSFDFVEFARAKSAILHLEVNFDGRAAQLSHRSNTLDDLPSIGEPTEQRSCHS